MQELTYETIKSRPRPSKDILKDIDVLPVSDLVKAAANNYFKEMKTEIHRNDQRKMLILRCLELAYKRFSIAPDMEEVCSRLGWKRDLIEKSRVKFDSFRTGIVDTHDEYFLYEQLIDRYADILSSEPYCLDITEQDRKNLKRLSNELLEHRSFRDKNATVFLAALFAYYLENTTKKYRKVDITTVFESSPPTVDRHKKMIIDYRG